MKKTLVLVFILLTINLISQDNYYIPKEIKKAIANKTRTTTGEPGENYWQNSADYKIIDELHQLSGKRFEKVKADENAEYDAVYEVNATEFQKMLAKPGHPHDNESVSALQGVKIDSAFIGSCTNGRIDDLRRAAAVLKGRKVAPGVVLKIVPSTDAVWQQALDEGLIAIYKEAGALVANAGCAGCAAGQIGQNGPGEITISTGNRNFAGKQGKGSVYLASPETVAASAVAGVITDINNIPEKAAEFLRS